MLPYKNIEITEFYRRECTGGFLFHRETIKTLYCLVFTMLRSYSVSAARSKWFMSDYSCIKVYKHLLSVAFVHKIVVTEHSRWRLGRGCRN